MDNGESDHENSSDEDSGTGKAVRNTLAFLFVGFVVFSAFTPAIDLLSFIARVFDVVSGR